MVNDSPLKPLDPLMLEPDEFGICAELYGPKVELDVRVKLVSGTYTAGRVGIKFSELPVKDRY